MATAKQQLVYDLRLVADAVETLNERITDMRLAWAVQRAQFRDDDTPYRSAEPNDRDRFPESDVYALMAALAALQDVTLSRELSLVRRVGMM